jgi:outer membrane receptor protein involved in Fe transport
MVLASVLAQAAVAAVAQPATPPPAQPQGVISYPVAFFAGQQVANAYEMLQRIPGFQLDTGDSVRGYEGAAGNVLVDGQRPTSKTDGLDQILIRIPAGQIERIDLIRGGAPGIDMQGKSVLANVVRKSGATFHGLFAVANNHLWDGRNMHGMRLELGGGDGTRTWEATARYGYGNDDGGSDGPRVRIKPDGTVISRGVERQESDGLQQTLTAGYSQPLFGGRISLNGRAFWDSWKSETRDVFTQPANLGVLNSTDPYDDFQTEAGARFNRDFGTRTKLEVVALRTDRDYHAFDLFTFGPIVSDFRQQRDESETILRSVLKRQQSSAVSFEFGAEGAINKLDSRQADFENGVEIQIPAANVQVEEKRGEVFAKTTWHPSSAWTLDGSVRYEASRITSSGDVVLEKTLRFLKPRMAVTWQAASNTQLRLVGERTVGQLNFDDFVAATDFAAGTGVSAGNPDLNPEQAWVAEAALEQRFWKSGAITLTFRHSELSDVIDRGPVFLPTGEVFDQPTNIGDGTKDELAVNLNLPSDHFGWKGGLLRAELNRRWSKVTDPTTLTSRHISRLRPLEWNVHYSQDLPQWGTSLGFDLYSGWSQESFRYNYISDVKLHNAYLITWVEKRLRPDLTLRVELQNVTKRGIRIDTKQFTGPRNIGVLDYIDDRDLIPGHSVYVRLRKTFGS